MIKTGKISNINNNYNEGDYVFWAPDIDHKVEALEDSVILNIRWYA